MKSSWKVVALVLLVLVIDQAIKIYVKTHFEYGEGVLIGGKEWAQVKFVENEGMAFGLTLGGVYGKLMLSLFRLVAVALLIFYIKRLLETRAPLGFVLSIGLILAGALGNILDSMFYGIMFTETHFHGGVAEFASAENPGYAPFLFGKVVDMWHFPLFRLTIPESFPFWKGEEIPFFNYIFNTADAAISVGVAMILIFQRRFFKDEKMETAEVTAPLAASTEAPILSEEISNEESKNEAAE